MALNRREKMMLALPVLVGGVLSFYNWVHEPLFERKALAQEQSTQVDAELRQAQARLQREGDLGARRATVTAQEQLIDSWVPGRRSAAMLIWHLSQAEMHADALIRSVVLTDRQQMAAAPATTPAAAPAAAPAGAQATAPAAAEAPTTLTVLRIQMKVDARFSGHLLFNQAIEQMPLFLNVDGLSLVRAEAVPLDKVGALLGEGNLSAAERLLGQHPVVSGTYQLNLYFKSEKAGPSGDATHFGSAPGRQDPFVLDGISEFMEFLIQFYANPEAFQNQEGPWNLNRPSPSWGQLG